jgi:hypothetical protein
MAATKIPKASIEWLVNRLHVGVSDEDVKKDIRRRARRYPDVSEAFIERMADYAVKHHHANQQLYQTVTSGRF